MSRPRVVYWNNVPSPYVVARFNAIARLESLDFEAWFCGRTESDRSWAVNENDFAFRYRYLRGGRVRLPIVGKRYLNPPSPLLHREVPDLLVSLYAEPTFLAGWTIARLRGVTTAFRYLPTSDVWVKRTGAKEAAKRQLFAHVQGFKTSGPEGVRRLLGYGVPEERIHIVTQSVDVERFRSGVCHWRPAREQVRAELGVSGTVFLYLGRLLMEKGLDDLLRAFRLVEEQATADVSLLVAGDGADERELRGLASSLGIRGVRFIGFVQQDDMPRIQAASDVFVFPTLGDANGVVVEEAMAGGLPVIASRAAADIDLRLGGGQAGLVVAPGATEALGSAMQALALDPARRVRMANHAARLVASRTDDAYARDFDTFVSKTLAMPRVR